jgi:hypothetical protein
MASNDIYGPHAAPASNQPATTVQPKLLRIFISYAHEDIQIANAVCKCLQTVLEGGFAMVNIDVAFLEVGSDYTNQIRARLNETDIFISLYTGKDKQWPAYEIGYFEGLAEKNDDRKLVPIFFKQPPSPISLKQGLKLDVPAEQLQGTLEAYRNTIKAMNRTHPLCAFLIAQQAVVDELRRKAGFPSARRPAEQDPVTCAQNMMLEIFTQLRATVEDTFKPQKQIVIKTSDVALRSCEPEIPADAVITQLGLGDPMSIFGLGAGERRWSEFLQQISGDEHAETWRAAISSVVTSSLDSRINVDNGQIIVSAGGEKAYRVILTSALRYYDGQREFHLYLVETLKRNDQGDRITTILLKAIELACRFRFMFFENGSAYSADSLCASHASTLPFKAAQLIHELNLMRKDAREYGLDQPAVWLDVLDRKLFVANAQAYEPIEKLIRVECVNILNARGNDVRLLELRQNLTGLLMELEIKVAGGNAAIIKYMTARLQRETGKSIVADDSEARAAANKSRLRRNTKSPSGGLGQTGD